jgi:hypothetical protein
MSLPISTIPILTGEAVEAFVKNAKEAEAHRGSICKLTNYGEAYRKNKEEDCGVVGLLTCS